MSAWALNHLGLKSHHSRVAAEFPTILKFTTYGFLSKVNLLWFVQGAARVLDKWLNNASILTPSAGLEYCIILFSYFLKWKHNLETSLLFHWFTQFEFSSTDKFCPYQPPSPFFFNPKQDSTDKITTENAGWRLRWEHTTFIDTQLWIPNEDGYSDLGRLSVNETSSQVMVSVRLAVRQQSLAVLQFWLTFFNIIPSSATTS